MKPQGPTRPHFYPCDIHLVDVLGNCQPLRMFAEMGNLGNSGPNNDNDVVPHVKKIFTRNIPDSRFEPFK